MCGQQVYLRNRVQKSYGGVMDIWFVQTRVSSAFIDVCLTVSV